MENVKLDPGFEEVPLDEGFEEVPLDNLSPSVTAAEPPTNNDGFDYQAGLSGLAQGTTLGFSDELGATADVASDYLTGNSVGKKWREYQKLREAANKADAERSPMSYTTGEIGGAIGAGLITAGLGTGGAAASIARSTLGPGAEAFLAAKNAGIVGSAASGLVEGAGLGAIQGLGTSQRDINDLTGLAKDAASAATIGGAIGGTVSGSMKALGSTLNIGKKALGNQGETNILRQVGKAYNYGKEGINLGSDKVLADLSRTKGKQFAKDLTDAILEADKLNGQRFGSVLEAAEASGIKINPDLQTQVDAEKLIGLVKNTPGLSDAIDTRPLDFLKTTIEKQKKGLSVSQAKEIQDHLDIVMEDLLQYNSNEGTAAKKLVNSIKNNLEKNIADNVPGYADASEKFSTFREKVPEMMLSGNIPEEFNTKFFGNLKNKKTDLYKKSLQVLRKANLPGEAVESERGIMSQLGENLTDLETSNPQAIKAMGGSAKEIADKLRSQSDEMALLRHSQGYEPSEGSQGIIKRTISGLAGTGRGIMTGVANKAGLAAQSAPVKMGQKLFTVPIDQLLVFAQKLKKFNQPMGDALERALNNKSDGAKKAILFKLLQDPNYRNLLREEGLDDEG